MTSWDVIVRNEHIKLQKMSCNYKTESLCSFPENAFSFGLL